MHWLILESGCQVANRFRSLSAILENHLVMTTVRRLLFQKPQSGLCFHLYFIIKWHWRPSSERHCRAIKLGKSSWTSGGGKLICSCANLSDCVLRKYCERWTVSNICLILKWWLIDCHGAFRHHVLFVHNTVGRHYVFMLYSVGLLVHLDKKLQHSNVASATVWYII